MEKKPNPQKELELLLADPENRGKRVCLHSCCAPCSSYCLLYLSECFEITVFYHNPNITEEAEFRKRAAEQQRLIEAYNRYAAAASAGDEKTLRMLWEESPAGAGLPFDAKEEPDEIKAEGGKSALYRWILERLCAPRYEIHYREGSCDPEVFMRLSKGLEEAPERGERCMGCYALRLTDTARFAAQQGGFDYFASTLTLSPLKDADAVNRFGRAAEEKTGVRYLPTDFKKKNGYLLSILLSEQFSLYRQDYCGCIYSKRAKRSNMEKI